MNHFSSIPKHYKRNNRSSRVALAVFLFCLFLSFFASAQANKQLQQAQQYLLQEESQLGYARADLSDLQVLNAYTDQHNGLTHVYVQQRFQGIDIKNAISGFHFSTSGELFHVANRFEKKLASRLVQASAKIRPETAIQKAAAAVDAGRIQPKAIRIGSDAAQTALFEKGDISLYDIPLELKYVSNEKGELTLSWEVQIYTTDAQHYYLLYIDAQTGSLLDQEDLVISCNFNHQHDSGCSSHDNHSMVKAPAAGQSIAAESPVNMDFNGNFYRVYDAPVETPNHGNRTYVFTNGDPVASPFGWHYDGLLNYNITRGNNVYAYEDQLGINAGLPTVGGLFPGQTLNFDFPIDFTQEPSTYTDAAVTNLFYWNNLVHDIFYHFGFTEPAGNFQTNNLGKGGLGNDAVMAEAQDGGGTNNANFLTLPDGLPGRMQMYLWSTSALAELVHIENSPSFPNGNASFFAIQAAFGPAITADGTTAELALVEANSESASTCSACGCGTGQGAGLPPANDVNGKIALIQRGDCSFIEKVMSAQAGGAVGAIVFNNTPGEPPISMGGDETGTTITIPSVMVSFEDGQTLLAELAQGIVNISLRNDGTAAPMKDGDLDNGIIAHEYGHGISTRLTGGPGTTCLSGDEQAGEGWSDYFALMTTFDANTLAGGGFTGRGIGTYVFDQPTTGLGIRPARYSRDFAINDYTYDDLNNSEITVPHGIGFIFATVLWDMTWELIDAHGYDPNLTSGNLDAGNILALQLVMDGLKLQPCSPTFLDSRDAILAADVALTGGENQCLIWKAFARRGMGFSAIAGTNSRGDEVAAFDMPPSCADQLAISVSSNFTKVQNGDVLTYTIQVKNTGSTLASAVNISNPVPAGTSYVQGSASHGGFLTANTVRFPLVNIGAGQTITRTFRVSVNTPEATTLLFDDDMEDGQNNWNAGFGFNSWGLQNSSANSGQFAWFANDPNSLSNQKLKLASAISLPANAELCFTHRFDTEQGFDAGVVEISNNGGFSWYDLGPHFSQNSYTDFVPFANNFYINGFAFGGNSNGYITTKADLSLFANQSIQLRFRFASDFATAGDGWYVDDVIIGTNVTTIENTAFFTSATANGDASSSTLVIEGPSQAAAQVPNELINPQADQTTTIGLVAFPNPAHDQVNVQLTSAMEGIAQLQLINAQGQVMQEKTIDLTEGRTIELNITQLPAGIYMINIQNDTSIGSSRIVIQR